jgi:hypothetical protein
MPLPARLPIYAEVDGEEFALSAGTDPLSIIEALASGSWWQMFKMIDSEQRLARRLTDPRDAFGLAQARELAVGIAEAVTGYAWYACCRLAATITTDFAGFDGIAAYRGFNPWSEPVARSLALVHHCLSMGCQDDVERAYLAFQLEGPQAAAQGSNLAQLESAGFAEWQASFGPDGTLLGNRDITA